MNIAETMKAAIGGVIAGATDRTEALTMVQTPVQELMAVMCLVQPPSVELATALHNYYGVDFVFKAGQLVGVQLN